MLYGILSQTWMLAWIETISSWSREKGDDDDSFLCLHAELNVHLIFQGSSLFSIAPGDMGLLKET